MSDTYEVEFGNRTIRYELQFSERKTLGIDVHPDLRVTVTAPIGSDSDLVAEKVRKRAPWILRQQRDFSRYLPHLPLRQYVSGETHRYLGKQYRLKVMQSQTSYEVVKLLRGRLQVYAADPSDREHVGALLDGWYRKRAKVVFREGLDQWFPRFERRGIDYPELVLRVMKTRWGSCTPGSRILLNPKLVQAPKQCIHYVIVHELCHLVVHDHSAEFHALLGTVMPDWEERKRKLNAFEF
ncbi:MAG: M48 family metallopeptidase [Anaerolineae bacterium]|nr:M48 family metallopeptidase [Anaerolineae bacterium]